MQYTHHVCVCVCVAISSVNNIYKKHSLYSLGFLKDLNLGRWMSTKLEQNGELHPTSTSHLIDDPSL